MSKFHTLRIKDIRRETADCVSIAFDVPNNLSESYHFQQGQNLTLMTNINGESVRRSYSICSSPQEKELRVAIKKVENGKFSTYANEILKIGETLEVMTPTGKFNTPIEPQKAKNYVAFAAGSGITPIISIIKTVLEEEPLSSFTLVYGNKNVQSIIFREEIEALKNKNLERLRVWHILSRERMDAPLFFGRIDADKCLGLCQHIIDVNDVDTFFLCGPEEMIFSVSDTLGDLGVPKNKIHFELFTSSDSLKQRNKKQTQNIDLSHKSKVTVKLDGISVDFELPFGGDNILDAASKQGLDVPFACKGGVCCTCKALLREGEVEMEINYGLEPDEVEAGYILTCQSHPITERIVVDYDV